MAERHNHSWFKHLNLLKLEIGRGKRSLVKGGIYQSKYQITIPRTLANNEQ
jgi:hypothetical protein